MKVRGGRVRPAIAIAAIVILSIVASSPASAARRSSPAVTPIIYVGARKMHVPALLERGRVLVPVRGVFEAIDARVAYEPPHFVVVRKDGAVVAAFILDRPQPFAGRRGRDLEGTPVRHDGRIYVPLRVVAQAAGATVRYSSHPSIVHIWPRRERSQIAAPASAQASIATAKPEQQAASAPFPWGALLALAAGSLLLGFLIVMAWRFAPQISARLRPPPVRRPVVAPPPPPEPIPLPDSVAVSTVAASGEARLRKELITEKRTIEVPVTREELVIEYAGTGGTVIVEGRILGPGETVRIALWEERVEVDVTKHQLVSADIIVEKRRIEGPLGVTDRLHHVEIGLIEPGPG